MSKEVNDQKNFGRIVLSLRNSIGITQEDFGEFIMESRVTINKIEKVEDVNELSNDLLFRLNFLASRLMFNDSFDRLVRLTASKVFGITYNELSQRITTSVDNSFVNLVLK